MDPFRPIMVISPQWQTRAMLAAQLGHQADYPVVSAPDVNEALLEIARARLAPRLLIVDAGAEIPAADVTRLMAAQPAAPVVLIASALRRAEFDPLGERAAGYLIRPASIGQIARAALAALEQNPGFCQKPGFLGNSHKEPR